MHALERHSVRPELQALRAAQRTALVHTLQSVLTLGINPELAVVLCAGTAYHTTAKYCPTSGLQGPQGSPHQVTRGVGGIHFIHSFQPSGTTTGATTEITPTAAISTWP